MTPHNLFKLLTFILHSVQMNFTCLNMRSRLNIVYLLLRSHTTVAKYAEYQAGTLEEAWIGDDSVRSVNPKIKFGDGTTR